LIPVNPLLATTDVPPIPAAKAWALSYDGRHGPVIDLSQAVPGTAPPRALLDRLAASAAEAGAATYGPILGDPALREAFARDMSAFYAGSVGAADVAVTAGCNQAFFASMLALAKAGDEVLLPTPWYFNHKMTLDMLGIAAVPLPARAQNGFVPTVEDARRLIGPRTRAVLLVTPNNPTGATYPAETIADFRDLAEAAGITLVLDETYRDFLPEGHGRPHRLFETDGWRGRLVHLYSFSKAYAIPGHRLGAIVADSALLAELAKVLDCIQICPPRPAQAPVAWAIEGTRAWREETRAGINRRIATFRSSIADAPGWEISAIGAYFAFVRHPFDENSEAVGERLAREAGVITLPGPFFGPGQERHIRFAFANVSDESLAGVSARLRLLGHTS
jgi:aspartate/methionine/tyrosine aminotransferase